MKILEAQNAVLSNYEVYTHLQESQTRFAARHRKEHRRPPMNYRSVTKDVLSYFHLHPNPLSQNPTTYSPESIATLVQRLAGFGLTKGEVLMIVNLRPTNDPTLHRCIEDYSERFTSEQQDQISEIIVDVLGTFPPGQGQKDEGGDEASQQQQQQPQQVTESVENGGAP